MIVCILCINAIVQGENAVRTKNFHALLVHMQGNKTEEIKSKTIVTLLIIARVAETPYSRVPYCGD